MKKPSKLKILLGELGHFIDETFSVIGLLIFFYVGVCVMLAFGGFLVHLLVLGIFHIDLCFVGKEDPSLSLWLLNNTIIGLMLAGITCGLIIIRDFFLNLHFIIMLIIM